MNICEVVRKVSRISEFAKQIPFLFSVNAFLFSKEKRVEAEKIK